MAIGTGTHWEGPLLGSRDLHEEVPVDVQSRRNRSVYWIDFNDANEFTAGTNWASDQIAANGTALLLASQPGGVLRVTSGAVNNDGIKRLQMAYGMTIPSTTDSLDGLPNRIVAVGARIAISDFSASNWFFGLAAPSTDVLSATGAMVTTGADNSFGFHHVGEATAQGGITGPDGNDVRLVSAGTAVANYQGTRLSAAQAPKPVPANAAVDGVFFEYGCRLDGLGRVEWYVDGVLRHRRQLGTNLAASVLHLSFANVNAGGADINMDIDYAWVMTSR